jgi:hypothetical protein
MNLLEFTVSATLHTYSLDPQTLFPNKFGNGCMIKYKSKFYFITVRHIGDFTNEALVIDTGQTPFEKDFSMYSIGSMNFYEAHKVSIDGQLHIEKYDEIDFAFCEISEPISILQQGMKFDEIVIPASHKIYLNIDSSGVYKPKQGEDYHFYGRVKPDIDDTFIRLHPRLFENLQYRSSNNYYDIYNFPYVINSSNDVEGCSGAPIFSESGVLTGLVSSINEGSNILFSISITKCLEMIDVYESVRFMK